MHVFEAVWKKTAGGKRSLLDRLDALEVVQRYDVVPFDVYSLMEWETLDYLQLGRMRHRAVDWSGEFGVVPPASDG